MPQQQQFSGNPFLLGDSERGSYDYSGMTPDEAQTQRNISQRRQMAKLMMYQGQQQAGKKGGMVGNIYVKASPMEGLAGVGQVGLGGLADYFLNKESKKAGDEADQLRKARIDEYLAATTDTPAVPGTPESAPLRPASYTDSNLGQLIKETRPEAPPVDPNAPELSLRPMNKVSQTMMDMQVKPPQRLSPEQEKFALRFGEGPQDPYAGGIMGDGTGPSVARTPFQPGTYTPEERGPSTPGTPGTPGIHRSQGDIMRAGLKAFAYGDPRLDKLVGHVTDQRNQQEQSKLMREERFARDTQANLERVSRDTALAGYQNELEKQRQAGQNERNESRIFSSEWMNANKQMPAAPMHPVTVEDPKNPGSQIVINAYDGKVIGTSGKLTDMGKLDDKSRRATAGLPGIIDEAEDVLNGLARTSSGEPVPLGTTPTASWTGKIVDAGMGIIGQSTKSADMATKLKTLGAALAAKMPRFEGPQSDADRKYYIEMSGMVGDDTVPISRRLEALSAVRKLYAGSAEATSAKGKPKTSAKNTFNPVTGKLE